MAKHTMVAVEITRAYPRGGRTYKPGKVIRVPEYAVESITKANPPFGKLVKGQAAKEAVTVDEPIATEDAPKKKKG